MASAINVLIEERIDDINWTANEKIVIEFIRNKQENIRHYTTTMIAKETYTSPSILVRIANKLGYDGYLAFKDAYLEEMTYLKRRFKNIDANKPFKANDDIMTIANKITKLKTESLEDTLSLINHDDLRKAINLIEKCEVIKIFAISNLCFLAEEACFKFRYLCVRDCSGKPTAFRRELGGGKPDRLRERPNPPKEKRTNTLKY